ncbi:MAG TPA: hypothetical protein VHA78_03790 [Candidatus Peribacteraceae bacterium]|nr:hypothetical protein [Candidatus Peribacteraceae bacterium]
MDTQKKYTIFAFIILCLMAFVFGVLIAPKLFEIAQINVCTQDTIDANHNGFSDYLDKTLAAGGYCGDGICDTSTENSVSCPTDCAASSSGYCGDGICDTSTENSISCPTDCSDYIGYFH